MEIRRNPPTAKLCEKKGGGVSGKKVLKYFSLNCLIILKILFFKVTINPLVHRIHIEI